MYKSHLILFLLPFAKSRTTSVHSFYQDPEETPNNSATFNAECNHIAEIAVRIVDLALG